MAISSALPRDNEVLILQRIVALFLNEPIDVRIIQKEFIEPGNLRKHLQVGEILGRKIFVDWLPVNRHHCETVPTIPGTADIAQ